MDDAGRPLTFGSLFAGIGGIDLGFERAAMVGKWQVEIDPYARGVLAKHWPDVRRWDDIRTFPPEPIDDWRVDVIAGGFPCQDISYAGKGAGLHGERSGLFFELIRVVRVLGPRIIVLENVAALLTRGLDQVLGTLASIGFDAEWHCIPAASVGAPHIRDRVFVLAYAGIAESRRLPGVRQQEVSRVGCSCEDVSELHGESRKAVPDAKLYRRQQGTEVPQGRQPIFAMSRRDVRRFAERNRGEGGVWFSESDVGGMFDGFSSQLDGGLINGDAAKKRARQIVQELRTIIQSEELQRCIRGLIGVSSTQVLLSILCEYEETKDRRWMEMERKEASRELLRGVWKHIEFACSPLRSRYNEQPAGEFANALRKLSSKTPSQFPAVWPIGEWENGVPRVAIKVPDRVHRLRGLGNAVVPQVAEFIGRRIVEAFTDKEGDYRG